MGEPDLVQPRLVAGRYQLEDLIGKGGMAEVWRARHLALNSYVAIKFLQGASAQNESTRRRFTTEAQVTAQLKSQHAVQVFDFGVTDEGQPYLVMELLEGETLGRRLEREGRLSVVDTARLLGQSARALHRAHQLGIVHRDFKPDNIVIGADDEGRDYVKVVDFGIAKLVGELEPASQAPLAMDSSAAARIAPFTKTGAILGTPFYMAPEQVRNAAEVDLRADIWAFGVVAFECLTGCAPFSGATLVELFDKIASGQHPDADKLEPSVPPGFHDWFEIACAPEPAKRFGDAQTAWKKLLVALECGKVDLDPSIGRSISLSGGAPIRPPVPLGDARVVLGSNAHAADENAITMDAPARRGVEARQKRSARGIPVAAKHSDRPPAPAPSEPQAMSVAIPVSPVPVHDPLVETTVRRRRPPRAARRARDRLRALFVAVPMLALILVLGWRVFSAPAPAPTPPAARLVPSALATESSAPTTPPSSHVAPDLSLAAPAPSASSGSPAAPPASANAPVTMKALSGRPRPHATPLPSATAPSPTSTPNDERAAPPPAPAPPPPTPPAVRVVDPSSYR